MLTASSHSALPYTTGPYAGHTTGSPDQPVSFEVTSVKGKKGKSKLKVHDFRIETVSMRCKLRDPVNFPWPAPGPPPSSTEYPVPAGGGKVKKKNGAFSTRQRSHPNLDSGIVGKVRGRLAVNAAHGTYEARFYDYYLDCRTGKKHWSAVPAVE